MRNIRSQFYSTEHNEHNVSNKKIYLPTHQLSISLPKHKKKNISSFIVSFESTPQEKLTKKTKISRRYTKNFTHLIESKYHLTNDDKDPYELFSERVKDNSIYLTDTNIKKTNKSKNSIFKIPNLSHSPNKKINNPENKYTMDINKKILDPEKLLSELFKKGTLKYESELNLRINTLRKKIKSEQELLDSIIDVNRKGKQKAPYSRNLQDLYHEAHFLVYGERKTQSRNLFLNFQNGNSFHKFINRQNFIKNEIKKNMEEENSGMRFPLIFEKLQSLSKEIKRPNFNFLLYSQEQESKSLLKNINKNFVRK